MIVTANEVKKNGIGMFDKLLDKFDNIILSVRGKKKYVVMDFERYQEIREYEIQKAYEEVMEDYKNGDYKVISAKEHIENLKKSLEDV